jgi:uncharacterized membrane protein
MDPVLSVVLPLGLFAATHLGLAWPPLRQLLVARLGPRGFTLAFSVVAWLTFGLAVSSYAAHAGEGPAGLALGAHPLARGLLIGVIVLGAMFMTGTFARYGSSPYAIGAKRAREPRGLERITRHAFFVGLASLGLAHALLATHLVGAVWMGTLGAYSVLGAWLQDRKLLVLRGEPYARWLAATSLVPFAAIAAGRQRLVLAELPYGMLALGVGLAWAVRAVHEHLFDHGGVYLIAAVVMGPLSIGLADWRQDRRRPAAPAAAR